MSHLVSGVCVRRHHLILDDDIYSQCLAVNGHNGSEDSDEEDVAPALPTTRRGRQIRLPARLLD